MQRQNMIFIFFVAFLLLIFVGYLFVIGGQKDIEDNKKLPEKSEKTSEEKLDDCSFAEKYNLLLVTDSDDKEYVFLTLRKDQVDEVMTVRIKRDIMPSLKVGRYYLFNFKTNKRIHDHIDEIFASSEILKVEDIGKKADNVDGETGICNTHLMEG